MLPNCIQDCIEYVTEHPETIWLFGKMETFGSTVEENNRVAAFFDYSFFDMIPEEQLHRLIFEGNCLPAPATFVNIQRNREIGVKNDERIPLLEDWPKWINLLRAGVKLHFVNKTIVKYRVTPGALSTGKVHSEAYLKSCAAVYLYYQFTPSFKESTHKIDEIHRYIRSKKILTGRWYWYVLNRLFKLCGNK